MPIKFDHLYCSLYHLLTLSDNDTSILLYLIIMIKNNKKQIIFSNCFFHFQLINLTIEIKVVSYQFGYAVQDEVGGDTIVYSFEKSLVRAFI